MKPSRRREKWQRAEEALGGAMFRVLRKGWAAFVGATALLSTLALAEDAVGTSHAEIASLQQRLTDAGCYSGAIDGAASAALDAAIKACPDQQPVFRIETGMHTQYIRSIGVDAQCTIAATGSDDKTVRLWSMPSGKLIRTERLPIGDGIYGKVYAVAVSPDGRLIAAGGRDAHDAVDGAVGLYLFDSATGTSLRRIGAFKGFILRLAFSPDGRRLAVGLQSGGVYVIDVANGDQLMADEDSRDDSSGLSFGPDGALFAVGEDGYLRRYDAALKRTAKVKTPGGKLPHSVAIDPSGKRLAVGYHDTHAVDLFDARDLKPLGPADTADSDRDDYPSSVAWSRDGEQLFGGGTLSKKFDGKDRYFVRSWTFDGRKVGADTAVSDKSIEDLTPCGSAIAFASGEPTFGLLKPHGIAVTLGATHSPDMRDKLGEAFKVSADATRVRFGLGYGSDKLVLFDVSAASLADAPAAPNDFLAPRVDGLDIKDWEDTKNPTFVGMRITAPNEKSRSLAIRPDRRVSCWEPSGTCAPSAPHARSAGHSRAERRLGRQLQRRRRSARGRLWRWDDPLAALERRAGAAGFVRRARGREGGSLGRRPAITWPRPAARI